MEWNSVEDKLLKAIEVLEKDALRYRWLRENDTNHSKGQPFIAYSMPGGIGRLTHNFADALIDAAMENKHE